jgi:hypothetical protein
VNGEEIFSMYRDPEESTSGGSVESTVPPEQWAEHLQQFTDRNASRRTTIEIDHADFGAQDLESDYPLRGVSYDDRDGRIEIMLGDLGDAASHMTHSIAEASEITILSGPDGRDELLRIVHPGGQTLLRVLDY